MPARRLRQGRRPAWLLAGLPASRPVPPPGAAGSHRAGPRDHRVPAPAGRRPVAVGLGNTIWVCRGQLSGDVVLVGEPAEDLLPPDPVGGEVDRFWWTGVGLSWGELAEGAVRPGGVVVPQVLAQDLSQVLLVDGRQPVQKLPAQGADEP